MARTDSNALVPVMGVYGQSGAPTFSADLTEVADDTAQLAAAEVADLASLPTTGNWMGRRIWVDSERESRWWDGTGWVRAIADTGWMDIPLNSAYTFQNRAPQVSRIGSVLYFHGDVKPKTGTFPANSVITVSTGTGVPVGFRPPVVENRQLAGNSAGVDVRGYIDAGGNLVIVTGPTVPAYADIGGLSAMRVD